MIEVYTGTSESAQLRIFSGGGRVNSASPVTAALYQGDTLVTENAVSVVPVEVSGETHEIYEYPIDITETADETQYTLVWSFEPSANVFAERRDEVRVVRPYVWPGRVRDEFPILANRTFDQIKHLERVVRFIINAFCGQDFGFQRDQERVVRGSGGSLLWLPQRIEKLTSVNGSAGAYTQYTALVNNGWAIALPNYSGYRNVKADIGLGFNRRIEFADDAYYKIRGDFGWKYVPQEIEQAASILVGRHEEPEQNWRRYNVDNVRGSDWRMEFSRASLETTGDADADILLQRYKAPAFGVL